MSTQFGLISPASYFASSCGVASQSYTVSTGQQLRISGETVNSADYDTYLITLSPGTWNIYTTDECGVVTESYLQVSSISVSLQTACSVVLPSFLENADPADNLHPSFCTSCDCTRKLSSEVGKTCALLACNW